MGSTALFDRIAGRAVDQAFGGRVLIEPRLLGGQYGDLEPDATRPAKEVVGHFAPTPKTVEIRGSVIGTEVKGGTRLSVSGDTTLAISFEAYASLGYEIIQGDLVTFLDEPGQPRYSVVKAPHRQGQDVEIFIAFEDRP